VLIFGGLPWVSLFPVPSIPSAETRGTDCFSFPAGVCWPWASARPEWMGHPPALAVTPTSPWQPVATRYNGQPARSAFTDDRHGFLVGSNGMILENRGCGVQLAGASPTSAEGRQIPPAPALTSKGQEVVAGQPGLLLRTGDGGARTGALLGLDTNFPVSPIS